MVPAMNLLFATSEAAPFCKTGGLGDVCGSLPVELSNLGHQATMVLPAFRQALNSGEPIESTGVEFTVSIGRKQVTGRFLKSRLPGSDVTVYLVEQPEYFDRAELYWENGSDYKDNCERFVFYCRAVLEAATAFDLDIDLVHCHDWTTGLIPAYLKTEFQGVPPFDKMASVFTIHNLAYQGNFWHWDMELTGLDWKYFNWQQMEFFGNLSFLKTGLSFADVLTTVSPQYAREIQSPPLSCGLEGILTHRRNDLFGIINGIDTTHWDPATDVYLGENNYDEHSYVVGKAACKAALQRELGLPERNDVPLIAMVGRLADQKGLDLLTKVMARWSNEREVQWAILGTGDAVYHTLLTELAARHPRKIAVSLEFSNALAHRIEAGADMFVMPSRYEPCGLNQLYSLKYGTVPVVRATGGLANTIVDYKANTANTGSSDAPANGFSFGPYTEEALDDALDRACQAYGDRTVWDTLIRTGMQQDWSWASSARKYDELYQRILVGSASG